MLFDLRFLLHETIHEGFVANVADLLDDRELDVLRPANWGELRPTRWLIAAIIQLNFDVSRSIDGKSTRFHFGTGFTF